MISFELNETEKKIEINYRGNTYSEISEDEIRSEIKKRKEARLVERIKEDLVSYVGLPPRGKGFVLSTRDDIMHDCLLMISQKIVRDMK